jgi:hypothetical protein
MRRHWLTFLIAGALLYFGAAAAPVLAQLDQAAIQSTK